MWSVNIIILVLVYSAGLATCRETVYFRSRNFYNILHWDAAIQDVSGETLYTVQYKSDVENKTFTTKEGCQNITALTCDLTNETPSLPDVHYIAQVMVNGRIYGTTIRFKPIAHTGLGPPILSTYVRASSIHVNATLPLGPKEVSIENIIIDSKNGPIKTSIEYTLTITSPAWAAQVKENTIGKFDLNLRKNRYCGYVVYKPSCEYGRPESEKSFFCIELPDDPGMLLPWPLMCAALLTGIAMMSVVCSYIYVKSGKKQSMPQSLEIASSKMPNILHVPDQNYSIISKPMISTPTSDPIVYATIRPVSNSSSGGYSSQDIPCQPLDGSAVSSVRTMEECSALNQRSTSSQSSDIYSSVAVHVSDVESEASQLHTHGKSSNLPLSSSIQNWNGGQTSPKLTSHGPGTFLSVDDFENNEGGQLLLPTKRDANGQLTLPLLILPFQSSTDGSVFNLEQKTLLSDLIDTSTEGPSLSELQRFDSVDSGCDDTTVNTPTQSYCNTHYCPHETPLPGLQSGCVKTLSSDINIQSGYKQNWMPEMLLGTQSQANGAYRRTDLPPAETVEGNEDAVSLEGSRHFFLGDWLVEIQE